MNIILIGMRGSGKTTVGKSLAEKLNRDFIEMDHLIEEKVSAKIADFVKKNGWKKFRQLETEIVADVAKLDNTIISTGGGVVENPANINILKKNGFIIYLKTEINTTYERIGHDRNRPLLTNANNMKQDLKRVFKKRKDLYESAAHLTAVTDNKSIPEITDEIIKSLKNN